MAFVEVKDQAPEGGAEFYKFNAIGDKLAGWFVNWREGRYGTEYLFRKADGSTVSINPTVRLRAQLEKAELEPGYAVIMTYTSDLPHPTNPEYSAIKIFKVLVDKAPEKKMPAAAAPKAKAVAPEDDF